LFLHPPLLLILVQADTSASTFLHLLSNIFPPNPFTFTFQYVAPIFFATYGTNPPLIVPHSPLQSSVPVFSTIRFLF
jgi:hypothetical protein